MVTKAVINVRRSSRKASVIFSPTLTEIGFYKMQLHNFYILV